MTNKPVTFISELSFSGSNSFYFDSKEKVILVGPNNSGKSQSLREIVKTCSEANSDRNLVVKKLKLSKNGTSEELKLFLDNQADFVDGYYQYNSWRIHESHINHWNGSYLLGSISQGFLKIISANDRLSICEQQVSISPSEQKHKPQHVLYENVLLMNKISQLFKRSFGKELMFDFRGGSKLPIHVGDLPNIPGNSDRVSNSYVEAVRKNPLLDKQGDGMKSYAGILFEAIVSNLDITLIDEPEAFLHPPQMRKLGETLASEVTGQLFVATHSSDILRGFLEGTQGNIRILRISREDEINVVMEASGETIKSLWEKPELRYSNALEGIFHEQTIICEHDSDCKLINSIADFIHNSSKEQWLDTAYVPTGGKHGVPKVAEVLRKIGVPIKAVFDIDFLDEESTVKKSVEAFGGNWQELRPIWKRLDSAVRKGIKAKTNSEIKIEITNILNNCDKEVLPKKDISDALKQDNEWNIVKKFGDRAIPNGQAQNDYKFLIDSLEKIGIYIIHVGEIENFCQEIGLHGPKFVTKLLSTISLSDERLSDLRTFVERMHKGPHCILANPHKIELLDPISEA